MEQQPQSPEVYQPPTKESLYQWFTLQQEYLDSTQGSIPVSIDRGNGSETIIIEDLVVVVGRNRPDMADDYRGPVVVYKTSEDDKEYRETSIETFASWRGLDQKGIESEIELLSAKDALVEPSKVPTAQEGKKEEKQSHFSERQKVIFEPIEIDEEESDYDFLFKKDDDSEDGKKRYEAYLEESRKKEKTGYKVTPESEADAIEQIKSVIQIDQPLSELFGGFTKATGISIDQVPKALRSNKELRLAVGAYLQSKVERIAHELPRRIRENTQKASNSAPDLRYRLTSQEVAAKYALAMLDGTFLRNREDNVYYDPNSDEGGGQHRTAARQVLNKRAD